MKIALISSLEQRGHSSLLVLPFWDSGKEACELSASLKAKLGLALKSGDFKGKNGETVVLYLEGEKEERVLLLGLGHESGVTEESVRRAYSSVARLAQAKSIAKVNVVAPHRGDLQKGMIEGLLLANYAFNSMKKESIAECPTCLMEELGFIGVRDERLIDELQVIAANVFFVRNLVNRNADGKLAVVLDELKGLPHSLKVDVLDKRALEREQMGLILAVSRGSSVDPCLIQVAYRGDPASKEQIVLVGKGITYDTGGLSLKPTDGMLDMKSDMAGSATVLGAVKAAAELGLKVNVVALMPMAENGIDGNSYKLGDVYRSHSGRTVEINNTDAEGRLVLADALSYAVKHLHPTCIVDLATLTGSIIMALGNDISGLFASDEKLAHDLLAASEKTGERVWRMPLVEEYKEAYKSDFADTTNSGGRDAGAVKGALFLQPFVGKTPWAHMDIAGPAFLAKPKHYNTTRATGYGVRLLVEFLKGRENR